MGKLKDRLLAREEAIKARKYPELRLQKEDPIKYEVLFSRLSSNVQNSREAAKQISASPVVREMGECIFSLFTPEGDSVCFSSGLMLHVASLGGTIKWMLDHDYEEEVGINEGDYFFNNDPHIGGSHSPDQCTVTPIFYEGKIVGWAGGLMHVLETGASEPGGASPTALTRYDEGIYWPCIKIAEKETLKKDLENIVIRGTRVPLYWQLDERGRMAGNRLIKQGVVELIREYGLDFYLEAIYEYIEDTRQAAQKKVRSMLFPGTYTQIGFHDIPNKGMPMRVALDYNVRIPCKTTISPEGRIFIDFEGVPPPGHHPNNSSLPCLTGNLINGLLQYVFFDLKPNQGILQSFDFHVPYPSTINPPMSSASSIFSTAMMAMSVNSLNVSKAYYSMGYREEVSAGYAPGSALLAGGLDQYDRPFGAVNFECSGGGTGAMACHDGIGTSYANFNPEVDFTDVEVWEKVLPLMYIGRRIKLDGAGCGKYQGGGGLESLYFVEHSDAVSVGSVTSQHKVHTSYGLMGGYPAQVMYHWLVKKTNLKECIDRQLPLPHSEGSDPDRPEWLGMIKGESEFLPGQNFTRPVMRYDLFHTFSMPGGGYGDPLERNPQLVKLDLGEDVISPRLAKSVYGVVVDPTSGEVDTGKTNALRMKIRAARKRRGVPAKKFLAKEREKVLSGKLPGMAASALNECLGNSVKFRDEFRKFWNLEERFTRI